MRTGGICTHILESGAISYLLSPTSLQNPNESSGHIFDSTVNNYLINVIKLENHTKFVYTNREIPYTPVPFLCYTSCYSLEHTLYLWRWDSLPCDDTLRRYKEINFTKLFDDFR